MRAVFEVIGNRETRSPLVITCEHASNDVDAPLVATESDQKYLAQHWGWDIGAADVTRRMVEEHDAVGVLSRFSRLVVDPNRHRDQEGLILTHVEGVPISFNQNLETSEVERRMQTFHAPFHDAISRVLRERVESGDPIALISIHSFTPRWGEEVREMELGVLFDLHEPAALAFAEIAQRHGFVTALNAPYSGRNALMYSAHRHGTEQGVLHVELEVRQDLIGDQEGAFAVGTRLAKIASEWLLHPAVNRS